MSRPPLTGPHLDILARLHAGQPRDHITEIGRYRGAWTAADVEQVAAWLQRDTENRRGPIKHPGGKPRPIPHGEMRGYQAHQRRGIPTTPDCGCDEAARQSRRDRADRKRTA